MREYLHQHPLVLLILILLAVWTVVWKGLALWKAARANDKIWFVVLLIINTAGILEICYIFLAHRETQLKQPTI